jgi:DnaK suppressor protein
MIVSILQLMGFAMGKPVHSRASENSEGPSSRGLSMTHNVQKVADDVEKSSRGKVIGQAHAQAQSARKKDVKAKVGKPAKAAKVQSGAKKISAKKAGPKAAAKPIVKPVAKPVAKSGTKSGTKPVTKLLAKPGVKTGAKEAVKAAVTAKPKISVPVAKKPAGKAGKAASVLAPKKAVAKKVLVTPSKPAVKLHNQKPAPKVAAKAVNVVINKKAKLALAKPAPASKAAPVVKVNVIAAARLVPLAVVPAVATVAPVPAKAGRPSSRLAQLTVPSMAQSVASTAAKSSYTQTTALPLIAPPLASATKRDPKLANNWKTKPAEQMSDAELLAMPDSEYMNEKQMAVFRLKLAILKQDILNSAGETTEHLREDTVVVPDPADRATIEEEHALELRTRDRERKLLKKIEQSINRIDAGDYGYCDETGEPIGVGRLLARPTATLSLEAQQRRELKQKMFGD